MCNTFGARLNRPEWATQHFQLTTDWELDEVGQLLHEVGHLLYEVVQLLYEGKLVNKILLTAIMGCGRLGTKVDLQLESIKAF